MGLWQKWIIIICVLLAAAMSGGWCLSTKHMGDHESYVSITAREMAQRGDWIVPYCNGEIRLQKTPLNYWLTAIMGKLTGQIDEFAVRFVSAAAGVLSVIAILYFVSRLLGFRIAVLASSVWLSSLAYFRYCHTGRPEMTLSSLVTISMLSFYAGLVCDTRKRQIIYMLIFWVSFSLAMLAKGPAPLLLIGFPLFFYVLIFKHFNKTPKMLPIVGTLIFLAIVLPWPLLVLKELAANAGPDSAGGCGEFWKREFLGRFMGQHAPGNKPFYYFFYVMFQHMAPWVVLVPMTLGAPFYKAWGQKRKAMFFLWFWFVGDVAIMSISGGKRMHYILPAMPAMAILAAVLLEDLLFVRIAHTKNFAQNFLIIHLAAVSVLIVAGFVKQVIMWQWLAVAIVLVVLTAVLFVKGKKTAGFTIIFTGYLICSIAFQQNAIMPNSSARYGKTFAAKLSNAVGDEKLIVYRYVTMRLVHYFGREIEIVSDISEINKRYQQGQWVVSMEPYLEKLEDNVQFEVVFREKEAIRSRGNPVEGVLFHKPDKTH